MFILLHPLLSLRVAESEVKVTLQLQLLASKVFRLLNILSIKFGCQMSTMAKKRAKITLEISILLLSLDTCVTVMNDLFI